MKFLAWSVPSKMYVHPGCTSSNLWHGIIDKTVEKCREKRDGRRWKNIHTRTHRFSRSIVVAKTFLLFLPWTTCLRTKLNLLFVSLERIQIECSLLIRTIETMNDDDSRRWWTRHLTRNGGKTLEKHSRSLTVGNHYYIGALVVLGRSSKFLASTLYVDIIMHSSTYRSRLSVYARAPTHTHTHTHSTLNHPAARERVTIHLRSVVGRRVTNIIEALAHLPPRRLLAGGRVTASAPSVGHLIVTIYPYLCGILWALRVTPILIYSFWLTSFNLPLFFPLAEWLEFEATLFNKMAFVGWNFQIRLLGTNP